jgi:putative membrane protein
VTLRRLLLAIVVVVYAWSAVRPVRAGAWFFETVWIPLGLAVVLLAARRSRLTTLVCVVLSVHAIVLAYGGHYTYAQTPFGDWVRDALGLHRNPYDRFGHFMQGFAPAIAIREVLWRRSPLRGNRWLPVLTVACCLAVSALWELLEWLGAYAFAGGDPAFLGSQGDPWDTQWDMAMALIGAVTAVALLSR